MRSQIRNLRKPGTMGMVFAILLLGAAIGLFNIIPVTSQSLVLNVVEAPEPVDIDDPWASVWDAADAQAVPLSAQQVTFPIGGGTVSTLTARALHDDDRLYVLIEWDDSEIDDTVNGAEEFTDAVALEFPLDPSQNPAYTMGQAGGAVNIWQWKASWQLDIAQGFAGTADLYPNTYADVYPGEGNPLYLPAEHVGNPVAQRDHGSPVEALIAEGFGSLTTSDVQDVLGSGEWRDGTWRVLFARDLAPARDDFTEFELGGATRVAFAVWDGGAGERNGLKSIANWIGLSLGGEIPPTDGTDGTDGQATGGSDDGEDEAVFWVIGIIAAVVVGAAAAVYALRRSGIAVSQRVLLIVVGVIAGFAVGLSIGVLRPLEDDDDHDAGASGGAAGGGGGTVTVSIPEGAGDAQPLDSPNEFDADEAPVDFSVNVLTVDAGTTVEWTSEDILVHTATAVDGSFDSGLLNEGDTFSFTFSKPGEFEYSCLPHPWMRARIIVK